MQYYAELKPRESPSAPPQSTGRRAYPPSLRVSDRAAPYATIADEDLGGKELQNRRNGERTGDRILNAM